MDSPPKTLTKEDERAIFEKTLLAGRIATDFVNKYPIPGVVTESDKMKAITSAVASLGVYNELLAPLGLSHTLERTTPTLIQMIRIMTAPDGHEDTFPPMPAPDDSVFPTGRLVRCVCKPGCDKELAAVEYRVLTEEEKKRFL